MTSEYYGGKPILNKSFEFESEENLTNLRALWTFYFAGSQTNWRIEKIEDNE